MDPGSPFGVTPLSSDQGTKPTQVRATIQSMGQSPIWNGWQEESIEDVGSSRVRIWSTFYGPSIAYFESALTARLCVSFCFDRILSGTYLFSGRPLWLLLQTSTSIGISIDGSFFPFACFWCFLLNWILLSWLYSGRQRRECCYLLF